MNRPGMFRSRVEAAVILGLACLVSLFLFGLVGMAAVITLDLPPIPPRAAP